MKLKLDPSLSRIWYVTATHRIKYESVKDLILVQYMHDDIERKSSQKNIPPMSSCAKKIVEFKKKN